MTQKKKRTYYIVADEWLSVWTNKRDKGLFDKKEEAEALMEWAKRTHGDWAKFKVLRVTLTASPAGWK